ncbi:MAG: hypothetical protein Fur0037_20480 [Planctomycetota bacterium]
MEYETLASALDAGIPIDALGGDASRGDLVLIQLLRSKKIAPSPAEEIVLSSAWAAGRAPSALRRCAESRRQKGAALRLLAQSLAYPALVLATAILVSFVTGQRFVLPAVLIPLAASVLLALSARRGLRRGTGRWLDLPWIGAWIRGAAEVPWIEALHGLYASGVTLLEAHPRALKACPVEAVRRRLEAADRLLQQREPLGECLARAGAAHAETIALISQGEACGDLEGALDRAARRRRDVAARDARRLCRLAGGAAYAYAAGIAIGVIFSFYAGYFGALRG